MSNCTICGFRLDENTTECPQCKRIQEKEVLDNSPKPQEETAVCRVCGNHYPKNAEACPHCKAIRKSGANPSGSTSRDAEKEYNDREEAMRDRSFEQFVPKEKSPITPAVMIAIGLVVVAIIAGIVLSIL